MKLLIGSALSYSDTFVSRIFTHDQNGPPKEFMTVSGGNTKSAAHVCVGFPAVRLLNPWFEFFSGGHFCSMRTFHILDPYGCCHFIVLE